MTPSRHLRAHTAGLTLICALLAASCHPAHVYAAPDAPTERARDITTPSCDTRSCVPPLRERDAVRAVFVAPAHTPSYGVIEAGSWSAFAVVRLANTPEHAALAPDLAARLADLRDGADGQAHTRDDRPFHALADLLKRAKLTSAELGGLVQAAHTTPVGLARDPWSWRVAAGHAFTTAEADAILAMANRCAPETLRHTVRLRARTVARITQARPLHDLDTLDALPWIDRAALVRLAHHSTTADCGAPRAPNTAMLTIAQLDALPELRRLRRVYTRPHADALVRELQAAPPTRTEDLRAQLHRRLRAPFAHQRPTRPSPPLRDHTLRAIAAEHIVAHLADHHTDLYRHAVDHDPDALVASLAALRQRESSWEVFEHRGAWIAAGRVLGRFVEVGFDLDTGERVHLLVEED